MSTMQYRFGFRSSGIFRDEAIATAHQIVDEEAAGKVRIHNGDGNGIRSGDKGFANAFVVAAHAAIAGNLGDFKHGEFRLGVLACVADQLVGDLFGGGHSRVGKDVAPEGTREIFVESPVQNRRSC